MGGRRKKKKPLVKYEKVPPNTASLSCLTLFMDRHQANDESDGKDDTMTNLCCPEKGFFNSLLPGTKLSNIDVRNWARC